MPMAPVSPSPLMPIAIILRVGTTAPRARRQRRHAAVHRVEAVRLVEEVRRALARTADARELDDLIRLHAEHEERVDDAFRDRVVPAPGAERSRNASSTRSSS